MKRSSAPSALSKRETGGPDAGPPASSCAGDGLHARTCRSSDGLLPRHFVFLRHSCCPTPLVTRILE